MPRMTFRSIISNSTRSTEVTFSETVSGQFFVYPSSYNWVTDWIEIEKGSKRFSGLTLNWTTMYTRLAITC